MFSYLGWGEPPFFFIVIKGLYIIIQKKNIILFWEWFTSRDAIVANEGLGRYSVFPKLKIMHVILVVTIASWVGGVDLRLT